MHVLQSFKAFVFENTKKKLKCYGFIKNCNLNKIVRNAKLIDKKNVPTKKGDNKDFTIF